VNDCGKSNEAKRNENEMEEVFRNPNLSIQSIKQMQQKHEESLNDIQCKLNEINQIKDKKDLNLE
jgi:hypothetical protein